LNYTRISRLWLRTDGAYIYYQIFCGLSRTKEDFFHVSGKFFTAVQGCNMSADKINIAILVKTAGA